MAKLYINKDIVADSDKFENWIMTGDDGISFPDVQAFIDWIDPSDNNIDIEIHSCGGDVIEGYAIYDALRNTGKIISTTVVGRCASMATVLLLAAPLERRKAYPHAKFCIHSPWTSYNGVIDRDTIESLKEGLEQEHEKIVSLYVERCGVDRAVLEEQMARDTWFGGETAKQLGFISEVIMPKSAKINKTIMGKEKEVTVKSSLIDRLLAKCGYAKIEDVPMSALVLTTSTGEELTVEREDGEIQVGDPASPDGEFVLEDGRTVVVEGGVITEIRDATSGDDDVEALKARISDLEQQVADLTANAKSDEDTAILAKVKNAGGIDALLRAAASKYTPAGRTQPTGRKPEEDKPQSKIEKLLEEKREKNKQRFGKQ